MTTRAETNKEIPLGKEVKYSSNYNPALLYRIERQDRAKVSFTCGLDYWIAYELTWLSSSGCPCNGILNLVIPSTSKYIVESKSLKLYLGSFALEKYLSADFLIATIKKDLSALLETDEIVLNYRDLKHSAKVSPEFFNAKLIDTDSIIISNFNQPSAELLKVTKEKIAEALISNTFRSLCPVTEQPDYASVVVEYSGSKINHSSLLEYLSSYRCKAGFHETCCEQIFEDIFKTCNPDSLTVACYFNRRGGISINPIRSNCQIKEVFLKPDQL